MARADSTGSARLLVIASEIMAFWAAYFGGETVTASCACAATMQSGNTQNRIRENVFMVNVSESWLRLLLFHFLMLNLFGSFCHFLKHGDTDEHKRDDD